MSKYYWTCPYCQSNNDPGESCDCQKIDEKPDNLIERSTTDDTSTNNMVDDYKVVKGV